MTSGCPASANLTPSTSRPAGTVKNPKARPGARRSVTAWERNRATRAASMTASTRNPATATASSASESRDGPSRNAPVETIPVAITNAK